MYVRNNNNNIKSVFIQNALHTYKYILYMYDFFSKCHIYPDKYSEYQIYTVFT